MSDRNDFDFEDDFLSDDNEPFDFDEEEGFPSGIGDEFESDMPEIEEEPPEPSTNRTFVVLAGIMILLFVAALGVVLFLATRPTGPNDADMTITAIVMQNLTVEAYVAQTGTQNAFNLALTQTAAAWTATPSPTLTPSLTETPAPLLTPTPTEFRPTITPTPSPNLTEFAILQLANGALTLTAIAANASPTPSPTEFIPPTEVPAELDLRSAFSTQIAYATQQGRFDQDSFSTRVAVATQVANTSMDSAAELALRDQLNATAGAIDSQVGAAQTAIAFIDSALESAAQQNQALATQLALVIPAGLQTQAALGTPGAEATVAAIGTQAALATQSAEMERSSSSSGKLTDTLVSRAEQATQVALLPAGQDSETATAAVLATRSAFATQAAQSTRAVVSTQAALATQLAFLTPPAFATQGAQATQAALATRQALIDMALGLTTPTPTPELSGLESVNMTATAIAGAFLTATAQAGTPFATIPAQIVPTALPQTGLFDDVVGGGSGGLGVLALSVVGLVGVIVVSRRLRRSGSQADRTEFPKDNH